MKLLGFGQDQGEESPKKNDSVTLLPTTTAYPLPTSTWSISLRDHLPVRSKEINSAMIPKSHFVTSFSQISLLLYRIEVE